MKKNKARIIVLEDQLIRAYNCISFMHGCLTDENYGYDYPEHTIQALDDITNLVEIPKYCHHSMNVNECDYCQQRIIHLSKLNKAKETLKDANI